MLILCAAVPLLLIIVLMTAFHAPAKYAMPAGWILTFLAAVFVWKQKFIVSCAWAIDGFLEALGVFCIIAGAVLIMNILKAGGAMKRIEAMFNHITPDRRIQAVLIGFVFSAFLEGAAGFGTPAAIAAPLMIGLGFPPLCAAVIALIFNSVPVSFGAIGAPTLTSCAILKPWLDKAGVNPHTFELTFSALTAAGHVICCFFVLFVAMYILCSKFGGEKSGKAALPMIPYIIFTTIVYALGYFFVAAFIGAEFPALAGSVFALAVLLATTRRGFLCPKKIWRFPGEAKETVQSVQSLENPAPGISLFRAWLPYILIALLLLASRLNLLCLKDVLKSGACTFSWKGILGLPAVNWSWNWGWCPGIMPFLPVAVFAIFLLKVEKKALKECCAITFKQCSSAAAALFFGVSMVYLYRNTNMEAAVQDASMLLTLAKALAALFSKFYIIIAPFIGVLGAFVSGSCTVSNTLFVGLQFDTALLVKLSPVIIAALQNIGAAAGNMVCINNVVAACATTNTTGKEGKIISMTIVPCVIYCIVALAVFGIIISIWPDPLSLLVLLTR